MSGYIAETIKELWFQLDIIWVTLVKIYFYAKNSI